MQHTFAIHMVDMAFGSMHGIDMRLLCFVLPVTVNRPVIGQLAQKRHGRMHRRGQWPLHQLHADVMHHIARKMVVTKTAFDIVNQLVIVIDQRDHKFGVFRMLQHSNQQKLGIAAMLTASVINFK